MHLFYLAVNDKGTEFAFPIRTYIYGEQLDTYVTASIEAMAARPDVQVEDKGFLKSDILTDLKACLKNSSRVKRGYKRIL